MWQYRTVAVVVAAVALTTGAVTGAQKSKAQTAPETFSSPVQARTSSGNSAATVTMRIDRYVSDADSKALIDKITSGGYPAFVDSLRQAKPAGQIGTGDVQLPIRLARERPTEKGRAILLVSDQPLYFVGGGRPDAKPREGYHLTIVQFTVDEFGFGTGTMAAAARVKPDGKGGVEVDDYAAEPIKLTFVRREIK
jgi:hypothetical protein